MKTSKFCLVIATVALVIGLFITPAKAHADTYQVFDLGGGSSFQTGIVGITTPGTVVTGVGPIGVNPCNAPLHTTCYETWVNGVMVSYSTTTPGLTYDIGTLCSPDISFKTTFNAFIGGATCNNGREVYYAADPGGLVPNGAGTFTGPNLSNYLGSYVADDIELNSSGDFVFDVSPGASGHTEIFEAIDLTTDQVPEPTSIFLLGTGVFVAMGTMRRRLFQ